MKKGKIRQILSFILCLSFMAAQISVPAFADSRADSGADLSYQTIDAMLSIGSYVPGEALVLLVEGASEDTAFLGASGRSDDLLDSAEVLMTVSPEAALTGIGKNTSEASENVSFLGSALQNDVRLAVIRNSRLSTRELLHRLSRTEGVIAVQPNYTHALSELADTGDTAAIPEISEIAEITEITEITETFDAAETVIAEDDTEKSFAEKSSGKSLLKVPSSTPSDYPDLTGYQWGFIKEGDFNTLSRVQVSHDPEFNMGIEGWNDPDNVNSEGYIAVLDTGIDYNNPDLAGVMAHLTPEQNAGTNGGEFGYSSYKDSGDPKDVHGHGTHCAGIIAAEWNGFGTSGICNGIKLIGVAAASEQGSFDDSNIIRGYEYLKALLNNGVEITAINNSWGSEGSAGPVFSAAVAELGELGAVSVFAAGNSNVDIDICPSITWGLYGNPYVIRVCAAEQGGGRSFFSNYGQDSCDVYAPGTEILSTIPSYLDLSCLPDADRAPVYANYFDGGLGERFHAGQNPPSVIGKLLDGEATKDDLPGTEDDIDDCIYAEYDGDSSFDEGTGVLMLSSSGGSKIAGSRIDLYIPVKKDLLDSITSFGACIYTRDNDGAFVYPVLYWQSNDPSDNALYSGLSDIFASEKYVLSEWSHMTVPIRSQAPKDGEYSLYYIPSSDDPDTVLVPVALVLTAAGESAQDIFMDSVGFGSENSHWELMDGTSMAAPAVTGAAAIAAKIQKDQGIELSPADSAKWRANYLKAHILKMPAGTNTCRQGGMVNLSISDDMLTPVINEILEDNEAVSAAIRGDYFGEEPGSVTAGETSCSISSWSASEITFLIPDGADTGELLITVTAANKMAGRAMMLHQSPSGTQVFEDVLPSPSEQLPSHFNTRTFVGSRGMVNGSLAAVKNYIFAILPDSTEYRMIEFLRYDVGKRVWDSPYDVGLGYVFHSSMAVKDDILYLYLSGLSRDSETFESHLISYDPEKDNFEFIDITEFGTGYYAAGIINADGKLLIAGGYDPYGSNPTEDNVAILSIEDETAHLQTVGDIFLIDSDGEKCPVLAPQLAYFDGSLYAAGGFCVMDDTRIRLRSMSRTTPDSSGRMHCEDASDLLPEGLMIDGRLFQPGFGLAASDEGLFLVGACVLKDDIRDSCDTYIMRSGSSSFEPWDRIFCTGQTTGVIATAYEGIIYGLGVSRYTAGSDGNLYFAASEKREIYEYTVTLDANGGRFPSGAFKGLETADITVTEGNTVEKPVDPVYKGYRFLYWTSDGDTEFDFSTPVTENMTLYALWQEAPGPDPDPVEDDESYTPSALQKNAPVPGAASITVSWDLRSDGIWNAVYAGSLLKNTFANITFNGKTFWYHFDVNGDMQTGWQLISGYWYYFNTEHDGYYGRMITGWHRDDQDGRTYYFDSTGKMLTGWQRIDGYWYYFNRNTTVSYMLVDGKWVYEFTDIRPYGSMYVNEKTPDGYLVDENGRWIQ